MRRQSAFTLIEIIVTIVVVGIAATALVGVFGTLARSSADPAIQQQATTIAEAYLEEILLRSFDDPQDAVKPAPTRARRAARSTTTCRITAASPPAPRLTSSATRWRRSRPTR